MHCLKSPWVNGCGTVGYFINAEICTCPNEQAGDLRASLTALLSCLTLQSALKEASGTADVLGEIADVYVDLGNLEKAAEVRCSVLRRCHCS